jgi:diacylglycerol kinase
MMMAAGADKPLQIWAGRTERGWRRDLQAAKDALDGLKVFVRSCRPLRYQVAGQLVYAACGLWRGFGLVSWLLFILGVGMGFIGEAINTTFEHVGNKLAKIADEPHGTVYRHDEDVRAIKHLAAGIVAMIVLIGLVLYTCLLIWAP